MTPTVTKALSHQTSMTTMDRVNFALKFAKTTLLFGPPGTGKSAVAHALHLAKRAIASINFSEDGIGAKLEGLWRPGKNEWEYVMGQGAIAWKEGRRLVVDELDRGSPDQQTMMYRFLDGHEDTQITLPGGDSIRPHKNFQCVTTMNGEPETLEEALLDRFEAVIYVEKPLPSAIAALPAHLQKIAKRTTSDTNKKTRIGLRKWIAYAKFEQEDPVLAAELVFGSRAPELARDIALAKAE